MGDKRNGSVVPTAYVNSSKLTACKFIAALLVVLAVGGKYLSGSSNDNEIGVGKLGILDNGNDADLTSEIKGGDKVIGNKKGSTTGNNGKKNKNKDTGKKQSSHSASPKLSDNVGEGDDSNAVAIATTKINNKKGDFPSLSSLTDGTKIKADVSWMLDFAIVGFAKCGTTWMMNYLRKNGRSSGEIWVNQGEVHFMRKAEGPAKMVNLMYKTHAADVLEGTKRLYGVKNPAEMEIEGSLGRYAEYFPHTKFFISLRHPVKWFESFFNFRQYHHYPSMIIRPTTKLIGECEPGYPYKPKCMTSCKTRKMDVCTVRANFHWALSRLGKTPMMSKEEKKLLQHEMSINPMPNKIFIMESRQIIYNHPAAQNFTRDVHDFLGLDKKLTKLQPYVPPADKYAEFSDKKAVKHLIHICDEEHDVVRKELVRIGKDAATWITKYLLKSPDVFVSSKDEFIKLMEDWGHDPCDKERLLL